MFDVGNAYLNADTTERLYTYAGTEFGDNKGCLLISLLISSSSS
jgi:hypothetical protein